MAKKKKRSEAKAKFQYSVELKGLFLVLVGLIGFGNFGVVGRLVKNFAIFMFGNWWAILLVLFVILGAYMVAKRKVPELKTSRLIGVYTLITALLLFSHITYLETETVKGLDIIKNTIDNIMISVSNTDMLRETGGGIVGALFSLLFVTLFGTTGTNIVVILLVIFGLIMLLNITLGDFSDKFKEWNEQRKENKNERKKLKLEQTQSEEENENVITISDLDELNNMDEKEEADENEEVIDSYYELPPISLLKDAKKPKKSNTAEFVQNNSKVIEQTMEDFNIKGKVVDIHIGPTVTQYEVELKAGTKINRVVSINKELALNLCAKDVRIQAPIPGKHTVGVETPNQVVSPVAIKEILSNVPRKLSKDKLIAALGKDIMGNVQLFDITKMPHLLIAGATGSGKSVCINNIIVSILMRNTPDEVKLVLVDPKKVELSMYEGVPHLLTPVVNNPKKASRALHNIVREMEHRYDMFNESGTKNIETYNSYVRKKYGKNSDKKIPYIVVIIDELADLMLVAQKEVEDSIMRITQLARAAGIHLIVATQRPSTDVITGIIKANIPSRISFAVSSSIDSRTILDSTGAEKLLGKGDMLFWPIGNNIPLRIQGSFIEDEEVFGVVNYCKKTGTVKYDESILEEKEDESKVVKGKTVNVDEEDPLYNEIVEFAIKAGKISASLLQRKYHLGYNRAARIIDLLEQRGIVGGQNGSKPREVLVKLDKDKKEKDE